MSHIIYTLGHNGRTVEEFRAILEKYGIKTVVDIRTSPRSTRFPQFNEDALRELCDAHGWIYHWAGRQLGGLREAIDRSPNTALEGSMRGFADYMLGPQFEKAAAQLINLSQKQPTLLLCAESDPYNCHRSLLADYMSLRSINVLHLLGVDNYQTHELRPEARKRNGDLVYDQVVNIH